MDELSLTVPAGEICVLVGPSGCGKTTAMRMVNRMIDITDGDILLDGRSVRERAPGGAAARDRLRDPADRAVPPPDGGRQHRHRAAAAGLVEGPHPRAGGRAARAGEPRPGARPASRYPGQLSGGQRQRVGVARALAVDPPLMLMDEPFGAIDPINRERLQNEFLRLQTEIRKTIVFVTHDIDEAIKMGDRIAVMQKGGQARPVRAARRAPDVPERALRGGLRGRRPRAQATGAPARARHRPLEGAARAGGRARGRGAREGRRVRPPLPAAGGRRRQAARLAQPSARSPASGCSDELRSRAEPVVELDDVLRDALADLLAARGPVRPGGGRRAAPWPACCRSRSSATRCKADPETGAERGRRAGPEA